MISYTLSEAGDEWRLLGPAGPESVKIVSHIRTNSLDTRRRAALEHQGGSSQNPTFWYTPTLSTAISAS
jgi:hypothetical protein